MALAAMKLGTAGFERGSGELYVMLNESRARGSSAARAWRSSSAAIASSICAWWNAETCRSAAVVAAGRESGVAGCGCGCGGGAGCAAAAKVNAAANAAVVKRRGGVHFRRDRKSTRLNSSHTVISYAVFCLKKKTK